MRTARALLALASLCGWGAVLGIAGCVAGSGGSWHEESTSLGWSAPLRAAPPANDSRERLPPALAYRPDVLNVGTAAFAYAGATPIAMRTLQVEPGPPLPVRVGDRHTVAPGETLMAIARNRLGDAARWRDIAAANPGLNPSHIAAGQQLHLPVNPAD